MPHPLIVNRQQVTVTADADKPLLWVLREQLHMPGTKFGCGAGLCGACTVLLDGQAVRACQTPILRPRGLKSSPKTRRSAATSCSKCAGPTPRKSASCRIKSANSCKASMPN